MHPQAAAERRIKAGDLVRIFNARGACLAGVALDESMRPDVLSLPMEPGSDQRIRAWRAVLSLMVIPTCSPETKARQSLPKAQVLIPV